MKVTTNDPVRLAKRVFWLAYLAAGKPSGMGVFQARNDATEDGVWKNVCNAGDYPFNANPPDEPYGDYVFGRMLKVGVTLTANSVEIRDGKADPEYQSWAHQYPTFGDLLNAAYSSIAKSV